MRWKRQTVCPRLTDTIHKALNVHPVTAQLLVARGVATADCARRFLKPGLEDLADPYLLPDMEAAVERLHRAIRQGERVHIHGDYDVDGITSTSVLTLALRAFGADVHPTIAVRGDGEVGLSVVSYQRDHAPHRPSLLITADCGSSNHEALGAAARDGVDVVVVDHHQMPAVAPPCHALLNPVRAESRYPFAALAAVGVAFHLVRALTMRMERDGGPPALRLDTLTDLVALGTVADVVPLVSDNRVFVRVGLEHMRAARRPGLCALLRAARLLRTDAREPSPTDGLNPRSIGFRVAPLLNAAGRMGNANLCVDLLTTTSYRDADVIVRSLEATNAERQRCEKRIQQEALELAETQRAAGKAALFLVQEHWHPGVLGIVASRLAERFHMPAVVATYDESGVAKGSVRSPEQVDMLEALASADAWLTTYGGHRVAAGLSFPIAHHDAIEEAIDRSVRAQREANASALGDRAWRVDGELPLHTLNDHLVEEFTKLAPFGAGHDEPVFVAYGVQPLQSRDFPGNQVRARLRSRGLVWDAIGYGLAGRAHLADPRVDILFSPRLRTKTRGIQRIELLLHEVKPSGDAP
mgnify:CR=1 FL=1